VHGLRTDAHPIRETLKTATLANALGDQLQVGTDLLAPVAWYTTANGEDAEDFLRLYAFRVVFQIEERVISQWRFASEPAAAVGQSKVETDLGIGKGRDVHRDVVLIGALEDAAPSGMACEVGPE